jgi:hypothetical protein
MMDRAQLRFRQDREMSLIIAAIMLALIWFGIVPAVMPAKE